MGLFDMFKGSPPDLTPKLALAVGLLHMIHADGAVEAEEIGQVLQALGNDKTLFDMPADMRNPRIWMPFSQNLLRY